MRKIALGTALILLLFPLSTFAAGEVCASGFGTAADNGTYSINGTYGSTNLYTNANGVNMWRYTTGAGWLISPSTPADAYNPSDYADSQLGNGGYVAPTTPDLVSAWAVSLFGASPAGTVVAGVCPPPRVMSDTYYFFSNVLGTLLPQLASAIIFAAALVGLFTRDFRKML